MPDDFFAVLGEPRRPWLDPERIKERFHERSRTEHPDHQGDGNEDTRFALLNQAQATLREPKARLRHLLELEFPAIRLAGPAAVPGTLAELFAPIHGLTQEIDTFLTKKASAPSALAKALLARDEFALIEKTQVRLEELESLQAEAMGELQSFDAEWAPGLPAAADRLHAFYQRFAYLSRWTSQLRERLFQLS